ncbi:DUF1826 domain-containing protein [Asaia lannensis]|uniref:DUF1826 domain-containing protein n=1 Tax=Asaia lannensis NBRC 102526 TaxID=1307926 RepID=A0ABT1CHT0_9PROT|nr:DUF1826 domain-containing protein [Asaia lannensis]MCO6160141.1 DUF1826 domain-containing protein [Asaia lannensis NBRC 102526]GBQ99678.1 hypothetical protein AA102526_1891 [Asaia lannensis NBRC 102526]
MFSIESWPDVSPLSGATDDAPRVRAGGLEDALSHLTREDLDMVVWARRPPEGWVQAMRAHLPDLTPFDLTGTVEQITQAVKDRQPEPVVGAGEHGHASYPAFLIEDIIHCASLAAALSGSNRLHLTLSTGTGGMPQPGGRLTLFCAYGHDDVCWYSGGGFGGAAMTRFAPFSLALMPARRETRLRLVPDPASLGVVLLIRAL